MSNFCNVNSARRLKKLPITLVDNKATDCYDLSFTLKSGASAVIETVPVTPFILTQLVNDTTTWTNNLAHPSYSSIVSTFNAFDATYSEVVTEVIATTSLGNQVLGCRIFDDGVRPIIGLSLGIHGDERDPAYALQDLVPKLISSQDPVYKYIRENACVFIIPTVNPDGMANPTVSTYGGTGTRNNGNNVNLNRNWPYFWSVALDTDKGTGPASEVETSGIIAWLSSHGITRAIGWFDAHGWNSRNEWGLLNEQIYHNFKVQNTQRAVYNGMQSLLKVRSYAGLTLYPLGVGQPTLVESRSRRKPYIYTWVQQAVAGNCYGCIVEYPQRENTGVINTAFVDIYKGYLAGCATAVAYSKAVTLGTSNAKPSLPAISVLNNNSLLTAWDSVNLRPQFFSMSGLRLSQVTVSGTPAIRSYRPENVAWPMVIAEAGYCQSATGADYDSFYIGPGISTVTQGGFLGQNKLTGQNKTHETFPFALSNCAMAYYNFNIYLVGGFTPTGSVYRNFVYRITAVPDGTGKLVGWSPVGTIATARQRHSVAVWQDKLVISGGRSSAAYLNNIEIYNTSSNTVSTLGTFNTARGWHTSAVYNNTLYIFGGWTGASTLTSIRKINLVTGVDTAAPVSLPNSRAEQGITVIDTKAYLCCGRTGSTTIQDDIYVYDMSNDTVTTLAYTVEQAAGVEEDDPNAVIPNPFVRSPAVFYNALDNVLSIIGGADSTGSSQQSAWDLDLDTATMYMRGTDVASWGYLRSSSAFTGVAGDKFSLNVALRNATTITDKKNPYARLTIITGPLSSPQRKLRCGYFVPPSNQFRVYTLPLVLQAGETEFRVYLRHYTEDTYLDIAAFQLTSNMYSGFIVPQTGYSGNTLTETFTRPIHSKGYARVVRGVISTIFGAQEVVTQTLLDFTCHASSYITSLKLIFTATENYTSGVDLGNGLVKYLQTGRLYMQYTSPDGTVNADLFPEGTIELNHAALSREWRLDVLNWSLTVDDTGFYFLLDFYGTVKRLNLPDGGLGSYISGFRADHTGCTYYTEGDS